jgi:hypothetical protein
LISIDKRISLGVREFGSLGVGVGIDLTQIILITISSKKKEFTRIKDRT